MTKLLTQNIEIKAFSTLLTGVIEPHAILWLALGFVLGHFTNPIIKSFYERKRKRKRKLNSDREIS